MLVEILDSLASLDRPVALVLDEYHVIRSQDAHDVMHLMTDRLPPRLHLVIASRVDLPLALSRLGELAQLARATRAGGCAR